MSRILLWTFLCFTISSAAEICTDETCKLVSAFSQLEEKFSILEEKYKNLEKAVHNLDNDSIPIGFVYIQLPGQVVPNVLWPEMTWSEVSPQYSGLFFRVVGGEAESFGIVQEDQTRQISRVENSYATFEEGFSNPIDLPESGWSDYGHAGHYSTNPQWSEGLRFHTSEGEVRPKNTAVKIWRRTA